MLKIAIKEEEDGCAQVNACEETNPFGLVAGNKLSPDEYQEFQGELRSGKAEAEISIEHAGEISTFTTLKDLDMHPHLTAVQLAFIEKKTKELGTMEKVKKFYSGKCHVSVFARNFAKLAFQAKEKQEAYVPVEDWERKGKTPKSLRPIDINIE